MRYYETNFQNWEQVLIDELRKEGYFVYGIRDGEGIHYTIEPRVYVNNIGFLVTDKEIVFDSKEPWQHITDTELVALGTEDVKIGDEIRVIADRISSEIALSKAKWDQGEADRERAFKEAIKNQDNRLERARHYNLSLRKDNPAVLSDGNQVMFQSIYDNGNGTQRILYFIKDTAGKIFVDSTEIDTKLNCRYSTMIKAVAKKHGLTA